MEQPFRTDVLSPDVLSPRHTNRGML